MFKDIKKQIIANFRKRDEGRVKMTKKCDKVIYTNFVKSNYAVIAFSFHSFWDPEYGFFSILGKVIDECKVISSIKFKTSSNDDIEKKITFEQVIKENNSFNDLFSSFKEETLEILERYIGKYEKEIKEKAKTLQEQYKKRLEHFIYGVIIFLKTYKGQTDYGQKMNSNVFLKIIDTIGGYLETEINANKKMDDLFQDKEIFAVLVNVNNNPEPMKIILNFGIDNFKNSEATCFNNLEEAKQEYYKICFSTFKNLLLKWNDGLEKDLSNLTDDLQKKIEQYEQMIEKEENERMQIDREN